MIYNVNRGKNPYRDSSYFMATSEEARENTKTVHIPTKEDIKRIERWR